ncbi:MAG: hypothetical protein V3V01_12925 [Acidimicrobiales bacterium]
MAAVVWSVVEQFVEGKSDDIICEDLIVVTTDFAAVIDGASDETGMKFGGWSGGRFAAEGDCSFLVDGQPNVGTKRVDDAAYGFRAAINSALLESGTSLTEILEDDPGAAAARPLFDLQQQLSNQQGPWGYGCVNGRPVPDRFVEVFPVANNATETVLTSDGFPDPRSSLAESEARLKHLLETDPAAIGELWTVGKSLRPGPNSVDDRAYLRLCRELS